VTAQAPPTYPLCDRIPGPTEELTNRAFNWDGTINDQDAYDQLQAILDADAFLGPTVEVTPWPSH
jgi:hypothetical protein